MDFITFKSLIPEIFLSLCILSQLVFNAYLTNNTQHNFPLINKELFSQLFIILTITLLLLLNLKIQGFFNNYLFINDSSSILLKIYLPPEFFDKINSQFVLNYVSKNKIKY